MQWGSDNSIIPLSRSFLPLPALNVWGKLRQLSPFCVRVRRFLLRLEGDWADHSWVGLISYWLTTQSVRAKVSILVIRRRVLEVPIRPIIAWSGSYDILGAACQNSWSVIPQHGCSAEPSSKIRAALYKECHVILAMSHVSQPKRLKKFATKICPPGLLGDICSVCKPTSPRPHPVSFPFPYVSRLLAFVPVIMATFLCNGKTCK